MTFIHIIEALVEFCVTLALWTDAQFSIDGKANQLVQLLLFILVNHVPAWNFQNIRFLTFGWLFQILQESWSQREADEALLVNESD